LNIVTSGVKGNLGLELYDAIGRLVMSEQFNVSVEGATIKLNLEKLPKGLYVLTCNAASKQINSTKVIVK
jgi:hypothetical protein